MTYTDPSLPHAAQPAAPAAHVQPERVVEVRRETSPMGWLVAGVVAIVAVLAVAFMVTARPPEPGVDQIAQAQEQGRAAGLIEGAQAGLQTGAQQAQLAAEASAREAASAAESVRLQTEATARSAADAAQDTAASAPAALDDGATAVPAPASDAPQ